MKCDISTINSFLTIKDKCNFVSKNCPYEYINFYSLYFCYMKGSAIFSFIAFSLILVILFFIISSTSDVFLSTAITKIVETFHINQNFAAVTLLAFGNGAPDVISSLIASSDEEGISFSINSLIGSGMFITSFVMGSVIFRGKEIFVKPNMFNRDIILYSISLFYIILIGIKKKITIIDSFIFIFVYWINIVLALYQGIETNKNIKKKNILTEENKLIIDEILSAGDYKTEKEINPPFKLGKEIELIQKKNSINDYYQEYMYIPLEQKQNEMKEQILDELKEDILKEQKLYINTKSYSESLNENIMMAKINFKKKYSFYKEIKWNETSYFLKIFYIIIDFPLTFIRELTIPIPENKNWNKSKFVFLPFCDFIFMSYVFKCK